jgi:hypothetical protein
MRTILIATALLIAFATQGAAEFRFEGSMNCKVKSNSIIEIIDGKPKQYSHYKDQFVVGDELLLEYESYRKIHEPKYLTVFFDISDPVRDKLLMQFGIVQEYQLIGAYKDRIYGSSFVDGAYMNFGKDSIRITQPTGNLNMKRYYKSDWQVLITQNGPLDHLAAQVFTLDCRTRVNKIDEIIEFIYSEKQD